MGRFKSPALRLQPVLLNWVVKKWYVYLVEAAAIGRQPGRPCDDISYYRFLACKNCIFFSRPLFRSLRLPAQPGLFFAANSCLQNHFPLSLCFATCRDGTGPENNLNLPDKSHYTGVLIAAIISLHNRRQRRIFLCHVMFGRYSTNGSTDGKPGKNY